MINPVEIQTPDGICDAWLAQPKGDGPWPGLLLCMDAVGPRPVLNAMADRLASHGYVVLLANLFYRERHAPIVTGVEFPARAGDLPEILRQVMPIVERFRPSAALKDLKLFADYLSKQPNVTAGRLGIFGYCMGGMMAIRAAAEYPDRFAAVASFHAGALVSDDPSSPHRLLPKLQAALYVAHADQDPHMSADQIRIFDQAATGLSIPVETEMYRGAHHHFTMADLPAYDEAAAEKHWRKLLALFKARL